MIKHIFFDLDGTLLPIDENEFTYHYLKEISLYLAKHGLDKELVVKALYKGMEAMYQNDGTKTNEEVFMNIFNKILNKNFTSNDFIPFYNSTYLNLEKAIKTRIQYDNLFNFLKESNVEAYLMTNPIFPKIAVINRMGFVGLKDDYFKYISSYENSHYTKGNSNYYLEVINKFKLNKDEVLMVGNNEFEDLMQIGKLGVKTLMIEDFLIKDEKCNIPYESIKMADLEARLKLLLKKGN